jgi:hypothetical protein
MGGGGGGAQPDRAARAAVTTIKRMMVPLRDILSRAPGRARATQADAAPRIKVFWFFSSEKNKNLLFLKKKKQKDFCFLGDAFGDTGLGREVYSAQSLDEGPFSRDFG